MINSPSVSPPTQESVLRYLTSLQETSQRAAELIEAVPLPRPLQSELHDAWRATRRKLSYFQRELSRSEEEGLEERLVLLHQTLQPDVISYQIRLGSMMIEDSCQDKTYVAQWNRLWTNFGCEI